MIIYSWFTYYKWWFFIAMLVYLMNKMKFNTWGWCVRLWKFLTCGRISNMLWRGWSGVQILPFGDGSKPYGFKCLRRWYIVPPSTQTTLSEGTFPELDDGIICSEPRCLMVKPWFPADFPLNSFNQSTLGSIWPILLYLGVVSIEWLPLFWWEERVLIG